MSSEDTFLQNRQLRDEARQHRKEAAVSEDAEARAAFAARLAELEKGADDALAAQKADAAMALWKEMQAHISSTVDTVTLPAHEVRLANELLGTLLQRIERERGKGKPGKKFAFSSKKKTPVVPEVPPPPTVVASDQGAAPGPDAVAVAPAASLPPGSALYSGRRNTTLFIPTGKAVFVRGCEGCTVYLHPIDGSVFLSDCRGCTVYACCHQMRIKSCADCRIFVWCGSTPVIEGCTGIAFGPFSAWTGLLASPSPTSSAVAPATTLLSHDAWATDVGRLKDLDHARSSHKNVDDFHWLKKQQSPNWRVLSEWECDGTPFEKVPTEPDVPE